MRIVNTMAFGWMDMDHVSRVTPVEFEENPHGRGGWHEFRIYVMMRNDPFVWKGQWDVHDEPTAEQSKEANDAMRSFLLAWRN